MTGWQDGTRSFHVTKLEDVLVRAKIGIADFERHPGHFQRLSVSVYLYRHGGRVHMPSLDQCMNYSPIYHYIQSWQERPHTDLLETLAEDLIEHCFEDESVEACQVELRKLDIYHNAASAGITFYRCRVDQS